MYSNSSLSNSSGHQSLNFCSSTSNVNTLNLVYSIFLILLILVGSVGNLAVFYAVAKSVQLRKKVINWFIISLAMSDLLTLLIQFPIKIDNALHNQMFCGAPALCYVFVIFDNWLNISSISTLFFISISRFLAIHRPMTYTTDISNNRAIYMIAFCWIQSAIWGGLSVFDWRTLRASVQITNQWCLNPNPLYYTIGFTLFIFLPLLMIGIMYIFAWKTLKANNARVTGSSQVEELKKKREIKATLALILVYCSFLLCWLPLFITALIQIWCLKCILRLKMENAKAFTWITLVFNNVLPSLSPVINPYLYAMCNQRYRSILAGIFIRGHQGEAVLSGRVSFLPIPDQTRLSSVIRQ